MDDYLKQTILTYNDQADQYAKKTTKYTPAPERDTFISLLPPKAKILEAGCGSRRDSAFFVSHGFSVVGFDLSNKLIEIAKKQVPQAAFHVMDLRNISVQEKFDGIWACASLLHLKRDEFPAVLKRFHKLLTSGGILFLLMKEGKGEKIVNSASMANKPRFFTYVTKEEINMLLTDAGFTVDRIVPWDQQDRQTERPSEMWLSCFARKV